MGLRTLDETDDVKPRCLWHHQLPDFKDFFASIIVKCSEGSLAMGSREWP